MTQNFLAEHYTLPRQVEPLANRFLWVSGAAAAQVPPGTRVSDRYQVVAPQIWFDLDPDRPPQLPEHLPESLQPYLWLFEHQRHLPTLYALVPLEDGETAILLERVPLNREGHLWPSLVNALKTASTALQIHWIEQILLLWEPLICQGVASSVLKLMNIRVCAGELRLLELLDDHENPLGMVNPQETEPASLRRLGQVLKSLLPLLHPEAAAAIAPMVQRLQTPEADLAESQAILRQAWQHYSQQQSLTVEAIALTDPGWRGGDNEDSCYPLAADLAESPQPDWIAVCDGLGGHVGGEVASQTAIAGLKLQVPQLLEHRQAPERPVESLAEQLRISLRIINDLIASRNQQDAEVLARMGTTLVLALKTPGPQPELTIAHIGDSRAYWLTPHLTERLTLDHDVATQTVTQGFLAYRSALRLTQGAALSQAMGVMASTGLQIPVQSFRVLEPGILLLCSDGLSDYGLVETFGHVDVGAVLRGELSLADWGQRWIDRARQLTGHDNISVAAFCCQLTEVAPSLISPVVSPSLELPLATATAQEPKPTDTVVAPEIVDRAVEPSFNLSWRTWLGAIALAMLLGAGIGLIVPAPTQPTPNLGVPVGPGDR
ncbi:PP2C family protein-serine/threonine phosphatase [Synechococcus elongatus]|uniref:PP2C family protein-serine/threonine phosphatase n=1 Tax=Synechococcus elongatus TaxID=32046 RepID=UPI000F7F22CD|nr:PP2C family serine/threonine-protein phosphatase [Synechococcus elongatus]